MTRMTRSLLKTTGLLAVIAAGVLGFGLMFKFDRYCYELGREGNTDVSEWIAGTKSYKRGLTLYFVDKSVEAEKK